ncbi:MAG: TetR/AcrR family transcriptional regulator [Gammaproteobacteria bacterium]|nr:TetR/AcrR family transcriptional regulator [Gammaproteobacteria bacterium]
MPHIQSLHNDTKSAILATAIPLFAAHGFDGVTMRQIASAIHLKAPALYNHYHDKNALYLAAVSYAFDDYQRQLRDIFALATHPLARLQHFVGSLCQFIDSNPHFFRLIRREFLDADAQRLTLLADNLISETDQALHALLKELMPQQSDAEIQLFASSVVGMVIHHFENRPLRRILNHDTPVATAAAITLHVNQLLAIYFKESPSHASLH